LELFGFECLTCRDGDPHNSTLKISTKLTFDQQLQQTLETLADRLRGETARSLAMLAGELASAVEAERAAAAALATAEAHMAAEREAGARLADALAAAERGADARVADAVSVAEQMAAVRLANAVATAQLEAGTRLTAADQQAGERLAAAVAAAEREAGERLATAVAAAQQEAGERQAAAVAAAQQEAGERQATAVAAEQQEAGERQTAAVAAAQQEAGERLAAAVAAAQQEAGERQTAAIAAAQREAGERQAAAVAAAELGAGERLAVAVAAAQRETGERLAAAVAAAQQEAGERLAAAVAAAQQEAGERQAAAVVPAQQEAGERLAAAIAAAEAQGREAGLQAGREEVREEGRQQGREEARLQGREGAHGDPRAAELVANERLVDSIRALDHARSLSEILETLASCAGREAKRIGILLLRNGQLRGWRFIGFGPALDGRSDYELRSGDAGVIAEAARTGLAASADSATPLSTPAFAELPPGREVLAVPIPMSGQVVAVLYGDQGSADLSDVERRVAWPAALEVMARHAARCLEAITAFRAAQVLTERPDVTPSVSAVAPRAGESAERTAVGATDDADQAAKRYARLLVSEIKLYHEGAVTAGCRERDLMTRLGGEIARARVLYEQRVPADARRGTDHFHNELVRTLANGDAGLLEARS
jgi:hypothetical protein